MTIRWVVSGFLILGGLAGFVLVSHGHGSPRLHLPLYVLAATVHLVAVLWSRKTRDSRSGLLFIVGTALVLRLVVCLTPESREGDYYRYMWDGALAANGISPYRYSPADVLNGDATSPELARLREDGHRILVRINHPELRTLYPPVAQSFFALGYWIRPFNSTAWRMVLLLLDATAGLLIVLLLRSAQLPLAWSISFLWNPLLIVETYHYRHLDLALTPFLLLFLWGLWKEKPYVSAGGLAVATAVKIWPVLLLPFLVIRFWPRRLFLLKASVAFLVLGALLFFPYWASVQAASSSGTVAYAKTWSANEFGFRGIQDVGLQLSKMTGFVVDSRIIARAILVFVLIAAGLWLSILANKNAIDQVALAVSSVVLLMVLIGPTVYPWYFLPAIAFAPFLKRPALLLWAPLLILTYLGHSIAYPTCVLAMIHLPAWLFLVLQVRDLIRQGADTHV